MHAIRIQKTLNSETLHLPELKPLLGRTVEIVIREVNAALVQPGTGDWETLKQLAQELRTGYDFAAWREQRDFDRQHAHDHLPRSFWMPSS